MGQTITDAWIQADSALDDGCSDCSAVQDTRVVHWTRAAGCSRAEGGSVVNNIRKKPGGHAALGRPKSPLEPH